MVAEGREVVLAAAGMGWGHLLRQRMQAARLGESAHQRVGVRIEKDRADGHAFGRQLLQQLEQVRQRAGARIDCDGHAALRMRELHAQELSQQFGWQVVHAEEAGVFQRMQGDRLARARNAGHQRYVARRGRRRRCRTLFDK